MAGTRGGRCISALFGHRPCVGIIKLHYEGDDAITVTE
jgi:hypothetical protein